ncbi:hypothetical protein U1Q18_030963 [Sarracenia purpurea var. burkii]
MPIGFKEINATFSHSFFSFVCFLHCEKETHLGENRQRRAPSLTLNRRCTMPPATTAPLHAGVDSRPSIITDRALHLQPSVYSTTNRCLNPHPWPNAPVPSSSSPKFQRIALSPINHQRTTLASIDHAVHRRPSLLR